MLSRTLRTSVGVTWRWSDLTLSLSDSRLSASWPGAASEGEGDPLGESVIAVFRAKQARLAGGLLDWSALESLMS